MTYSIKDTKMKKKLKSINNIKQRYTLKKNKSFCQYFSNKKFSATSMFNSTINSNEK